MIPKLNITSRFLAILLGLLINNSFSKTLSFISLQTFTVDSNEVELSPDTLLKDSIIIDEISDGAPEFPVKYTAKDSIDFDNTNQIVYLFGEAKVDYGKISLEAHKIKVFIAKNEVHAFCKKDSVTGKILKKVVFTDDGDSFEAPQMKYNFNTKKGRIIQATRQEGEMYLLSDVGKKMPNNEIFLKKGKITTCDAEHPHFYFDSRKLKIIPGKKIIAGPTNLIIRELRTPLILPFGIFPNNQKRNSGILIPSYGTQFQSFGLSDLGYHWAINDYIHAEFLSSVYFSGRTLLSGEFKYRKKYKYNGNVFFRHTKGVSGTPDISGYEITKDFNIRWGFQQDPKAHPKSSFRINIDYKSPKFNQTQNLNTTTALSTVQGQNNSQISWNWKFNDKLNLGTTYSLNQNFAENRINLTLPNANLSVRAHKWKIWGIAGTLGGKVEMKNEVQMGDSTFFTKEIFENLRNGAKANITMNLTGTVNVLKYIKITPPNLKWNSYLITEEVSKIQSEIGLINETNKTFKHAYDFSLSNLGINTKIYGIYKFSKNGYLKGFKHTTTPTVSITYRPDFFIDLQNINKTVFDTVRNENLQFSRYSSALYKPNASKAANINFILDQNLKSKVKDLSDSTGLKSKKINIINRFILNSSYNFLADSLNWSDLRINLNTAPLFLKNLNIDGLISPYEIDKEGRKYNSLLWKKRQLGRMTSFVVQTSLSLNRNMFTKWMFGLEKGPKDDFGWTVDINYTYNYNKPSYESSYYQTLGLRGKVQLTQKTDFNYSLPVNLKTKNFAGEGYFNFTRNLHCWEMKMNWFPFRDNLWCLFSISPKAGLLKDLGQKRTFEEKRRQ